MGKTILPNSTNVVPTTHSTAWQQMRKHAGLVLLQEEACLRVDAAGLPGGVAAGASENRHPEVKEKAEEVVGRGRSRKADKKKTRGRCAGLQLPPGGPRGPIWNLRGLSKHAERTLLR